MRYTKDPYSYLAWKVHSLGAVLIEWTVFQPDVERFPCRKLRDRNHEVAPGIADKPFDASLVVPLARTAVAIPDLRTANSK